MKEFIEFRVPEENARRHLPADLGTRGTWIRKIELASADPLVSEIGRLQGGFSRSGKSFFHGWRVRRHYSRGELEKAELLHMWPEKIFEPAGEECGTVYDDSVACPICGAGAPQIAPLFLDGRRLPRRVDFAQTIAGEIVMSSRAMLTFREMGFRGGEYGAVQLVNDRGRPAEDFFQLTVPRPTVRLHPGTRLGDDPFDSQNSGSCPQGHLAGLNLLSEVIVRREGFPEADVMATSEMVGVRRGLLRPRPVYLLSPLAWRAIARDGLKGLTIEVAHVA